MHHNTVLTTQYSKHLQKSRCIYNIYKHNFQSFILLKRHQRQTVSSVRISNVINAKGVKFACYLSKSRLVSRYRHHWILVIAILFTEHCVFSTHLLCNAVQINCFYNCIVMYRDVYCDTNITTCIVDYCIVTALMSNTVASSCMPVYKLTTASCKARATAS